MKPSIILTILTTSILNVIMTTAFPLSNQMEKRHDSMKCNGHSSLCDKTYDSLVYIGAHNSYADGNSLSDNQNKNVTKQLEDGIRLLQIQGHQFGEPSLENPSSISLCHTSCFLENGGYLETYLSEVKDWLDKNPNEVLTLLPVNPERINIMNWSKAFSKAGLDSLAFVPTDFQPQPLGSSNWPTLKSLIDSGKRLIVFLDYESNTSEVPYILDEFSNIFENHFDQTILPYDCSVDRGSQNYQSKMFLQNEAFDHIVLGISLPDKVTEESITNFANGTNGIINTVERCAKEIGVRATFVLTDYYDVPNMNGVFEAAAQLNNVSNAGSLKASNSISSVKIIISSLIPILVVSFLS